jgi:hypothetical protein
VAEKQLARIQSITLQEFDLVDTPIASVVLLEDHDELFGMVILGIRKDEDDTPVPIHIHYMYPKEDDQSLEDYAMEIAVSIDPFVESVMPVAVVIGIDGDIKQEIELDL